MTTPQSDSPKRRKKVKFDSSQGILVCPEPHPDTTRRPARPSIPRGGPPRPWMSLPPPKKLRPPRRQRRTRPEREHGGRKMTEQQPNPPGRKVRVIPAGPNKVIVFLRARVIPRFGHAARIILVIEPGHGSDGGLQPKKLRPPRRQMRISPDERVNAMEPMPELLWTVIENSKPSLQRLADWLESASREDVERFALTYEWAAQEIAEYWQGPLVDDVQYSEDDTEDLCNWIVSQGRKLWGQAVSEEIDLADLRGFVIVLNRDKFLNFQGGLSTLTRRNTTATWPRSLWLTPFTNDGSGSGWTSD